MHKSYTERAHGRVNLMGEHTDYNGGWVLPTPIAQYTQVTITRRPDKIVLIRSGLDPQGHERSYSYNLGREHPTATWTDYLEGATKLLREFLTGSKQTFHGFSAIIESTVPEGSGLSSSAALEISFLKAIRSAYSLDISDIDLALLGQRIENEFVGARVGIMDQMAATLASAGEALFLDTRTLEYERIHLPLGLMDIMIINSGISHKLSEGDGGYNQRRTECEEAAKLLGLKQLRDVSINQLLKSSLPEVLLKRARHVVTENIRVQETVKALKEEDLTYLGQLFADSHASMRDDYQVSIPEIDTLVEICMDQPEVYGARLTGGGFGGSIVAITKKKMAQKIAQLVLKEYEQKTGMKGAILAAGNL